MLPDQPVSASGNVLLPANCGTAAAEELRVQLLIAGTGVDGTRIDAGGVQTVGQAVLQLLIAARREAAAAGRPFGYVASSQAFVEQVARCCLTDALGIETARESVS
jgi:anti-anti-sigma regulatory factor